MEVTAQEAVQSYEDCPHCKQKNSVLMQTHLTGEQNGMCLDCGYQFVRRVILNNKKEPLLTIDGKFNYQVEETTPYGVVTIDSMDDIQVYGITSEEELQEVILPFIDINKSIIQSATLKKWNGEAFETINLLNKTQESGT